MPPAINLTGQVFGKLTALHRVGPACGHVRWRCRCECGVIGEYLSNNLRTGRSTSCGCQARAGLAARRTTHGHTRGRQNSLTFSSWQAMRARCENPNHRSYPDYGGSGVKVCERWQLFENFLADMGERPSGKTIDRIENRKGYEPGNCRWATAKEQRANQARSQRHAGEARP